MMMVVREMERGEGKNKKRGGGEEKLGGTSGVLWLTPELTTDWEIG